MRRIVLRSAGIEAALLRFDAWWQARAPRERVLLSVLAVLVAGTVLIGGIVRPLIASRAEARADIRSWETLMARVRAAGTLGAAPAPAAAGSPNEAIQAAAVRAGLAATITVENGDFRAVVADAPYDAVIRWTDDVARTGGLDIVSVALVRTAVPGRVSATVDFRP